MFEGFRHLLFIFRGKRVILMETIYLQMTDIAKYYIAGREVTAALNGVTLSFAGGEFVAITGESGSGKSTLAHILAGIIPWEKGTLLVNGQSTFQYNEADWEQYRRDKISFVAQNYGILPGNTVLENVVSTLRLAGMETKCAKQEAERLLKQVDLWKMRKRRAARLSSGQKQRLSIARALAKPAPILIADEPTSNLDPANSRRMLELLKQAAKERLVIMVTHDYETAQSYVTRQIVIHDGTVESDTQLRKPETGTEAETEKSEEKQQTKVKERKVHTKNSQTARLGWYIARLQLHARPAWTLFMTAFFALTAFAVFAFLGTFIVSLDDTSTRIYDNEAFRNGDDARIVVARQDHAPMTEEDYNALLSVTWAESLERYDAVLDVNYYYQFEVDYEYRYAIDFSDMYGPAQYTDAVIFNSHNSFIRTIPLLADDSSFLKAGRLPEHMNEVVAVGDESLIGTTLPVYFLDRKNWGADAYLLYEMTIVGVTDYGNGLYFEERVGRMLNQILYYAEEASGCIYGVDNGLTDEEVTVTNAMVKKWASRYQEVPETLTVSDLNQTGEACLTLTGTNYSAYPYYLEMSEENFDRLNLQASCEQVSVFLKDYSYTDRAIEAIQKLGYEAVSPYRVSSVKQDTERANARLTTLVVCMLALVTVILAQIIVLSAMFRMEIKSYAGLSNLGLSCRIGQGSVFWQILLLTAIGQAFGFAFVWLGARQGMKQFTDIIKYLEPLHLVTLSLLHLAASMLVVAAVCIMLRRQVFLYFRRSLDVDLSELEEESGKEVGA